MTGGDTTARPRQTPAEVGSAEYGSSTMTAPPALAAKSGSFHETRLGWLILTTVWGISVAYVGVHLQQGWIPPDAGMLAQMAERVLHGQVPYRDYNEVYTGGLTYLNAIALHLFGQNFFSMRIPLFLFFLGWIPSVYFIARRFASPLTAGAVTLLAVAWSLPNYPEAMPSWYNLFFATWGLLALLWYTESKKSRWLWIAGFCGGLSFAVKISGLYFIAAALLFFVFREQWLASQCPPPQRRAGLLYRSFVSCALLLFLAVLVAAISARPTFTEFFTFIVPGACLVALLLWREWRKPRSTNAFGFSGLFSTLLPFLGGTLIPVVILLAWFAGHSALRAWFEGVFVHSYVHVLWIGYPPFPPKVGLVTLAPTLLIVLAACDRNMSVRRLARNGSPLILAVVLFAAWKSATIHQLVGTAVAVLIPFLAIAASFHFFSSASSSPDAQRVFLTVAVVAICSLIQFPTSGSEYFCYVAPLLILALLSVISRAPARDGVALGSLLFFYLIFAVWLHTPAYLAVMRSRPRQPFSLRTLNIPRAGGIKARARVAAEFQDLVRLIKSHAHGHYIYCTPDCPEVYFLSGERNPTRTIWDFLDRDYLNVPARNQRILETIDVHRVNVVVFNSGPWTVSGIVSPALRAKLDQQFPESNTIGHFEVRWKRRQPRPSRSRATISSPGANIDVPGVKPAGPGKTRSAATKISLSSKEPSGSDNPKYKAKPN